MKECKYRCWDKENQQYIYFNLRDLVGHWSGYVFDYKTQAIISSSPSIGETTFISNCLLQQYTGTNDKNGVEIYEGDIITWYEIGGHQMTETVRWENSLSGFFPINSWHPSLPLVIGNDIGLI